MHSRKNFLKLITVGGIGTAILGTGGLEKALAEEPNHSNISSPRITFDQAASDINCRQQYLEQLIQEMITKGDLGSDFYEVVERIIYDHSGQKSYYDNLHRYFVSGGFGDEYLWMLFSGDSRFRSAPSEEFLANIKEFLKTPAGLEELAFKILESQFIELKKLQKSGNNAETHFDVKSFALGQPSTIYFREDLFGFQEDLPEFADFPSEERIKSSIVHEYRHALDFYSGIKIGHACIDNSAIEWVFQDVFNLIAEMRAFNQSLNIDFSFNKGIKGNGEYHIEYVKDAAHLYNLIDEAKRLANEIKNPEGTYKTSYYLHRDSNVLALESQLKELKPLESHLARVSAPFLRALAKWQPIT